MKKLTKAKPNFEHFIKEIKQYGTTLDTIKNKKARKTYEDAPTLLHPQLLLMQIHDHLTGHPQRYITYPAHVAQ